MTTTPDWITDSLGEIRLQRHWRLRRTVESLGGGRCRIDGRELISFATNDYLGLAHDQRVREAAIQCLLESPTGATASALVAGRGIWQERLEQAICEFEGTAACLLFPSGFAANLGTVSALADSDDVIFCDRFNHASLVDGCRLAGSRLVVYRHDRLDQLDRRLARFDGRRRFLVTDSLFSMDGDCAPLPELVNLCRRHQVFLIVDEAHATGVLGASGRGACEDQGVESDVDVRIGTLSKSIGLLGGFATGHTDVLELLWHRARTQIYSTALPPAVCAAACKSLALIKSEPWRREHLQALSTRLRERVVAAGLETIPGATGPIVPIILRTPDAALSASANLEKLGLLVPAIRPPTVPSGTSRLRISLSAAHQPSDVDQLATALESIVRPGHNA